MNFQISLKPPYNSKKTFTCLEISISTLIYHVQILDHSWMSFKHMHYINTFHFLHMFMVIGSTCLLLNLLALTLKQYSLLMVCHITIIDLWLQVGSRSKTKMITFRPINKININTLHDDLANSDLLMKPKSTLCELVNQYNETLSKLLDKHAPKQTKSVQVRPPSPWMSNDIIVAKRRRRYLERIWRRTRSPIDTKQLHICNNMMSKAKSDYYTHFYHNKF